MDKLSTTLSYHKKNILTVILIAVFIWSLFSVRWNMELFHRGGKVTILQLGKSLLQPDLSYETLKLGIISAFRTLAYAVAGMSIAFIIAFVLGVLASGVLSNSKIGYHFSKVFFRGLLGFMRAIHELVWAWFFVASIGLTPFAAIFALCIPYGGTLGRIYADILNDVPSEPIKALRLAGASKMQLLIYGYLPMAKLDIISYTMYRFECAVRSSTIMSFVGLGGLGFQIQLALQDLNYNRVWTYLFFLIALVLAIDLWSSKLRRELVK